MKNVKVSNRTARQIDALRDNMGSFESEKIEIADTMCGLVDMIQFAADDNDVTPFTNDIFKALRIISNYNEVISNLNATQDCQFAKIGVTQFMKTSEDID